MSSPTPNASLPDSPSIMKKRSPVKSIIHRIYPKEHIIDLLTNKPKVQRNKTDIRIISDFLADKYDYFTQLKTPEDMPKLEKLCTVVNLEEFKAGENIINFGDEGEKFYIVLEGTVGIYLPSYPQKTMMIRDYIAYLKQILYEEENQLKYERIIEKNIDSKLDIDFLMNISFDGDQGRREMVFIIEDYYKVNEKSDGFPFGEIALIKKSKRNATIRALVDCKLLSIEKSDYNKIIRELEERRLEKELNDFKKVYPLFEHWTLNHLIRLFNCFSRQSLTKGDYLYRQNEESDCVYIILSGTFEVYSLISFGWVGEFLKYIKDASRNLVHLLGKSDIPLKERQLRELYNETLQKALKSPCQYDPLKTVLGAQSQLHKDNILEITKEEEDLKDPFNLFKVQLKTVNYQDVIGIEDALECKKRFHFVRCVSPLAEVQKVKLYDFYRLINRNPEMSNKETLKSIIAEKKSIFYRQIKGFMQGMTVKYQRKFESKFTSFLNERREREPIKLFSLQKSNKEEEEYDSNSKDKEIMESIPGAMTTSSKNDLSVVNMKALLNNTKTLVNERKIHMRLLTGSNRHNTNQTPKKRKNMHQSANSLMTLGNIDLTHTQTQTYTQQTQQTVGNSHLRPYTNLILRTNSRNLSKTNAYPISNFLQFNNSKPIRAQGTIPINKTSSLSKNFNSKSMTEDYKLHLMSNYTALQTEIKRMTGLTKLKPKSSLIQNIYSSSDAKIIQIESYNQKPHQSIPNKCPIAHKKSSSLHIHIQMKDYKSLRQSHRLSYK